jgi:hypothetical protein
MYIGMHVLRARECGIDMHDYAHGPRTKQRNYSAATQNQTSSIETILCDHNPSLAQAVETPSEAMLMAFQGCKN